MSASTFTITVPATTANLGPGFDCIGAALTLYNQFKFSLLDADTPLRIEAKGLEASKVKTDESNLAYQAVVRFYQAIGQALPSMQIDIDLGVPLARGLGSSATAIVGGLVGANLIAGSPLSLGELMELAIAIEGHPDNVVPALLGGCQLAAKKEGNKPPKPTQNVETRHVASAPDAKTTHIASAPQTTHIASAPDPQTTHIASNDWIVSEVPWDRGVVPVVAIPDFELSTQEARRVLPDAVSRADAIFNAAHLGMLVRGLETGRGDWIETALQDRLHQPFRQALIPGYEAVRLAAMTAGAWGLVISGAGPTLLALVNAELAQDVEVAMQQAWARVSISAIVRSLSVDTQGARGFAG